jgi:hypothetical protein
MELYLESLIADHQPIPKEDLIFKPLNILIWVSIPQSNNRDELFLVNF